MSRTIEVDFLPASVEEAKEKSRPSFLALLWGLISLGALLTPAGIAMWNRKLVGVVRLCWSVADVLLVFFSAMNYFTHFGLLVNTSDSF